METRSGGPSHSSSYGQACAYGQACLQCFKSKCRCVARPDGHGCERCFRLKKQCQPSDSIRKRYSQKNQDSSAQIAKLESRIEALVSIVQSVAESTGVSSNVQRTLSEEGISLGPDAAHSAPDGTYADKGGGPTPVTNSTSTASSHSSPSQLRGPSQQDLPALIPSDPDAENCLEIFRSRMLPCFPFMHMPPELTAQQLRCDRPFLFKAIAIVTTPIVEVRHARVEDLKRTLATAALLQNRSTIDLLLGLLTYIAWTPDSFLNKGSTLSHLMMLAMSMVYNLRLTKPLPFDARIMAMRFGEINPSLNEEESLEQKRALLACFMLSSTISSYFGLIDAMRWTPQMDEALRVISSNTGCSTDESLTFQVRLQLLAQRAAAVREQYEVDRIRDSATSTSLQVPTYLYLKGLQSQLEELKCSWMPSMNQKDHLIAYAHYVELCINEAARPASSSAPLLTIPGSNDNTSTDCPVPGFGRLECLWRSVECIKSYFDVFYSLPPRTYTGLSLIYWSQLVRCMMTLKHLSMLEDPAWDTQAVRNKIDLIPLLDWLLEKIGMASQEAGEVSDDGTFRQFAKMMRMSRAWVGSRWKTGPPSAAGGGVEAGGAAGQGLAMPAGEESVLVDPFRMNWMPDVDFGNDRLFGEMFGWSAMP